MGLQKVKIDKMLTTRARCNFTHVLHEKTHSFSTNQTRVIFSSTLLQKKWGEMPQSDFHDHPQ